ncbi:MAG: DMT family transporter [Jatrophihabitantaceae bacterium]
MSIELAIGLGVASAIVYGTSIVVQHQVVHQPGGDEDPAGLLQTVRDPRWLLAIGGDFIGFVLQIGALSAGSVVLIQPLVVLMLPVAMIAGPLLGGPRPRPGDYLGALAVVGGLAVFLSLIGVPGASHAPHPRRMILAIALALILGTVACLAVTGRRAVIRGAMYGVVAGVYFGTLGVLVDAASDRYSVGGIHELVASLRGLVPLIGIVLLGLGGIVLTQVSFQVGALGATLPANLSADPLAGVVLGSILLREHIPVGPWHLVGYGLCLAAVIAGAVRLAAPHAAVDPVH